jgi:hypothetical protein
MQKAKTRIKKIVASIVILSIIISVFFLIYQNSQKPIDTVYVYHSSFGIRYPEYKLDLKNKECWMYTLPDSGDMIERDAESKNEGFNSKIALDSEKIQAFLLISKKNGFTHWRENYDNPSVMDGHQWGMTIIFSDSAEKHISGSNKYPWTWTQMYDAFEELTGEKVLLLEDDWMS